MNKIISKKLFFLALVLFLSGCFEGGTPIIDSSFVRPGTENYSEQSLLAITYPEEGVVFDGQKITLQGTCGASDTLIYAESSTAVSATVSSLCVSNKWNLAVHLNQQVEGLINFNIFSVSSSGNIIGKKSSFFVKDTKAPDLKLASSKQIEGGFSLKGSCEDNLPIVISGADVLNAPMQTICSGQAFNISVLVPATTGSKNIILSQTDGANHTSTINTRLNYTATVTTPPVSEVIVLPTVAFLAPAELSFVNQNSFKSFLLSGKCSEQGQPVLVNAGANTVSAICTNQSWSASLNFQGLQDGLVDVFVNHKNSAAVSAASVKRTFNKDTLSPVISFSQPVQNSHLTSAAKYKISVAGFCDENNQTVILQNSVSSQTTSIQCIGGQWGQTMDYSTLNEGLFNLTAYMIDKAGNKSQLQSLTLIKDPPPPPPTVTIASPAANSYINSAGASAVNLSGTCSEVGQLVTVSGPVSKSVPCTSSKNWNAQLNLSAIADGPLAFTVKHQNESLESVATESRSFIKDTSIPMLEILTPTEGQIISSSASSNLVVSGKCSDVGSNNIMISGAAVATTSCLSSKTWSTNINISNVSSTEVQLNIIIRDAATNSALVTRNFLKSAGTPSLSLTVPLTTQAGNAVAVKADLSTISATEVSFNLRTALSTDKSLLKQAEANQDFVALNEQIKFSPGEKSKTIYIQTLANNILPGNRLFKIQLDQSQGLNMTASEYEITLTNSNSPIYGADVAALNARTGPARLSDMYFKGNQQFMYVSQSDGNDANNGLSESKAFKTISKAAALATPGTTVFVKNGTYPEQIKPAQSGSSEAYIQYKAFPGHSPVLKGSVAVNSVQAITESEVIPAKVPVWPPLTLIRDNFENGNLSGFSPVFQGSNRSAVCSTQKKFGANSACLSFDGTKRVNGLLKSLPSTVDESFVRMFVYLDNNFDLDAANTSSSSNSVRWNLLTLYEGTTARAVISLVKTASMGFKLDGRVLTTVTANPNSSILNFYKGAPGQIKKGQWYQIELRFKGHSAKGGAEVWLNSGSVGANYDRTKTPDEYAGIDTTGLRINGFSIGDVETSSTSAAASTTYPKAGSVVYVDEVRATVGMPSAELENTVPLTYYKAPYTKSLYSGYGTSKPEIVNVFDNAQFSEGSTLENVPDIYTLSSGSFIASATDSAIYFRSPKDVSVTGKTIEYGVKDGGFILDNKKYIVIQNFKFHGFNNPTDGAVHLDNGSQNNYVLSNVIYNNAGSAVKLDSYNSPQGCVYSTAGGCTILRRPDSNWIAGNHFYDNHLEFGSGMRINNSSNSVIEYNLFESTFGSNISLECDDSVSCKGTVIRHNHFMSAKESNIYAARYIFDSYIYSNILTGARESSYTTMKGGLRGSSGGSGIHIARGSSRNTVFNNLVYDVDTGGMTLRANVSDNILFNNTVAFVAQKGVGTGIDYQRDANEVKLPDTNGNGALDGYEPDYNNISFNNVITNTPDTSRCFDLEGYNTGTSDIMTPPNSYDKSNLSDFNVFYKCGRVSSFNGNSYDDSKFTNYVDATLAISGIKRDGNSTLYPKTQQLFMNESNRDFKLKAIIPGACNLKTNCPWKLVD